MTPTEQFLDSVEKGIIPDYPPQFDEDTFNSSFLSVTAKARSFCTKRGMWAIVDKQWTKELAKWIDDRKCLEIMAGVGWLSKALSNHGIDIIATDDSSWTTKGKRHENMSPVHPIEKLDAINAIKKYKERDILLVSWPPYTDETIVKCCDEWGYDKPIIYIGEGEGGCCATKSFWLRFKEADNVPRIELPKWGGIHDYIFVGYWGKVDNVCADCSYDAREDIQAAQVMYTE